MGAAWSGPPYDFANSILIQVRRPALIGCNGKILMKLRLYLPQFQEFPDSCTKLDHAMFESGVEHLNYERRGVLEQATKMR
jgi:hypothetical protein